MELLVLDTQGLQSPARFTWHMLRVVLFLWPVESIIDYHSIWEQILTRVNHDVIHQMFDASCERMSKYSISYLKLGSVMQSCRLPGKYFPGRWSIYKKWCPFMSGDRPKCHPEKTLLIKIALHGGHHFYIVTTVNWMWCQRWCFRCHVPPEISLGDIMIYTRHLTGNSLISTVAVTQRSSFLHVSSFQK
jgi:hypothetical protein